MKGARVKINLSHVAKVLELVSNLSDLFTPGFKSQSDGKTIGVA